MLKNLKQVIYQCGRRRTVRRKGRGMDKRIIKKKKKNTSTRNIQLFSFQENILTGTLSLTCGFITPRRRWELIITHQYHTKVGRCFDFFGLCVCLRNVNHLALTNIIKSNRLLIFYFEISMWSLYTDCDSHERHFLASRGQRTNVQKCSRGPR